MKKTIWIPVVLGLLAIFGWQGCCHHDDGDGFCGKKGVVIGIDFRKCVCCGGYFIEVEGDTLRSWNLPQPFMDEIAGEDFPISVYLEWQPAATPCLGDEIEVSCIRKR